MRSCRFCGISIEHRYHKAKYCSNSCLHKEYYRNNRAKSLVAAKNQKRKQYGLTHEDWEQIFDSQGRVCAICKTNVSGGRGWHTDHNHSTGIVRGILCYRCNVGLGQFHDSLQLLDSAKNYLELTDGRN